MISHARDNSHPLYDDLVELQKSSLFWVSGAAAGSAVGLLCFAAGRPDVGQPKVWIVVASLMLATGVARLLSDRVYPVAATVLCLGLVLTIAAAAMVYSARDILFAVPLAVFVFPVLVGDRTTLTLAAGAAATVWLLRATNAVPLSDSDASMIAALTAGSVGLTWIAYRPTRVALDLAWTTSLEERRKTQEVRQRQAELAQMSKSFSDTCERLEQANVSLAHARRAAEEARQLKEEFAIAISHELRTPLNLIIGFSEMMVREPTIEEGGCVPVAFRGDVETIYRNACHLSDLVDDVLDLGRLDAQRLALQKRLSDLTEVIHGATSAVESLYRKASLTLDVEIPSDLPLLYVDPTRIRQVLINLLTNAVRYTDEGSVRVMARRDGGDVTILVSDTGAGIPAEDLPYVFEGFRQAGQPHRRGGFGIGLTVSKRLVEMHAGAMWVTSEPGRGTEFAFSLPIVDNVAPVPAEPSRRLLERHYLDGSHERVVLVLDPDAEAATIFQRYLDGYQVRVAASPSDAGRQVESGEFDAVIVTDPGASSAAAELVARGPAPRAPILRCSLRTANVTGRELGAAAFLAKPISREQLRQVVRRLAGQPRRVLVVDDDPSMVDLLGRMLHSLVPDCQVDTAANGEQGLAAARWAIEHGGLDLVLLDLLMPGLNGHDFLQTWNRDAALGRIPVVVVSAAGEERHDVIVGDVVEVRRGDGLTVGDVMRIVRASLDCLLSPEHSVVSDDVSTTRASRSG